MKIVIANDSGLTEAHVAKLKEMGEVVVFSDTTAENAAERLADAEIAVIDAYVTPVTRELISKLPYVRFISINSTGFDKVDIEALRASKVMLSNVPGFSTEAVAEMAVGLMFSIVRKIPQADRAFREAGLITVDPGTEAASVYMGTDLRGRVMGVVGLGAIGMRVAEMGLGLGMKVIAYNRTPKSMAGIQERTLDAVISECDVLIVCLALNDETKGLISKARIEALKPGAHIVSIAGMDIFDKIALRETLDSGGIAGAAFDTADESMLNIQNTVLTPHIAYNTREAAENMGSIILANIESYIRGTPQNIVS